MILGREHLDLALLALNAPRPQDAWPELVRRLMACGADTHFILNYNIPFHDVTKRFPRPEESFSYMFPSDHWERGLTDPAFIKNDPIARRVAVAQETFFLDTARPRDVAVHEGEVAYIQQLREGGLKFGAVVSMHNRQERTVSGLCVGVGFDGDGDEALLRRRKGLLRILATYFNEGLSLRGRLDAFGRSPLTDRERECLAWAGVGRTTSEISDLLCISDNTVNEHLKNAARKLGASNRIQACTRAFLLSFIDGP